MGWLKLRQYPANHAMCSFIDSSGNASGSIRRWLFIDYKINVFILYFLFSDMSVLDTRVTYREMTQGSQAEGYNAKKNKTFHLESTCFQAISGSLGLFDYVKQSRQSLC